MRAPRHKTQLSPILTFTTYPPLPEPLHTSFSPTLPTSRTIFPPTFPHRSNRFFPIFTPLSAPRPPKKSPHAPKPPTPHRKSSQSSREHARAWHHLFRLRGHGDDRPSLGAPEGPKRPSGVHGRRLQTPTDNGPRTQRPIGAWTRFMAPSPLWGGLFFTTPQKGSGGLSHLQGTRHASGMVQPR